MMLVDRLATVKLLACAVEGVITDGSIQYGTGNIEIRSFNLRDSLAMKLARANGLPVAWITGRRSPPVARHADELNVRLYADVLNKEAVLRGAVEDFGVSLEEIAYIGDDINDLPALRLVGLPIAVADAAPEVLAAAAHVTQAPGGAGAIREVVEWIFRSRQCWDRAIEVYLTNVHTPTIAGRVRRMNEEE